MESLFGLMLLLLTLSSFVCATTPNPKDDDVDRSYYIAINEVYWNYFPDNSQQHLSQYKVNLDRRGVYKKALYQEYTDDSFSTIKHQPVWMGFLGPTLLAEYRQFISVTLYNNASRPYSLHTHGVLYIKQFEGAPYKDGVHMNTSAGLRDVLLPGQTYRYVFEAVKEASPDEDDPDCLTWMYHSHVDTVRDINSGLVGMLLTCKKGVLSAARNSPRYTLYMSMVDERKSWYAWDNRVSVREGLREGETAQGLSVLNGFTFGQLPGLESCVGQKVTWHLAGFGSSSDIHSISISGHVFEYFNRREHNINVNAAQFATATTTSHKQGRWLLHCDNTDQDSNGMYAYLHAVSCPHIIQPTRHIRAVRFHYIAAEEIPWEYAPSGRSGENWESLTEPDRTSEKYLKLMGGTYKKAIFRAYEDYTFKQSKEHPEHLGILGPVIRAEVGDLIQIVFKNKASRPYSLHAEGVMFSKRSEGMSYADGSNHKKDNSVAPGDQYTYFWYVPEDMGPKDSDPQCLTHVYTSAVDRVKDVQSGLIGPLLICQNGTLDPTGEKQMNVDKEFVLLMSVFDESKSWYLQDNLQSAGLDSSLSRNTVFTDTLKMHSMNGLMYGNLQGLNMCLGDSVAWHVFTVGSTSDMHALYFHGSTFSQVHTHHSTVGLFPGDRRTLYMNPDVAGVWKLDCATNSHPDAGEFTLYTVGECPGKTTKEDKLTSGQKRIFYIQAEEIQWNYAPSGKDMLVDRPLPTDMKYTNFTKVVYRAYTNEKFTTTLQKRGEEYMGILGPVIRTEIGDNLKIVFRNRGPQAFSIHPTGLTYRRANNRFDQPAVAPGETFTYVWRIRESEGPGPNDPNCINSPYYSDVNVNRDTNTGLVGTLVICRPGILDKNGLRTDVDRDLSIYYSIIDESVSWMAQQNAEAIQAQSGNSDFTYADLPEFIAINGYVFGNQPRPTMMQWEQVDWYLMTMGDERDLHPVHFHGNDVIVYDGNRHAGDVNQLWPGVYSTVSMHTINPGIWLYHCHVNYHITNGMESMYEVLRGPRPAAKLVPAKGNQARPIRHKNPAKDTNL